MRNRNRGIDSPCDGNARGGPLCLAALQSRDPEALERFESYFGPLIRLKLRSQYPKQYEDGLTREVLWNVLVKVDNGVPLDAHGLPRLVVEVCHETARRRMSIRTEPLLLDLLFARM
jgi:hypothetical protein